MKNRIEKKKKNLVKYKVGEEVICTNASGIIFEGEIVKIVNREKKRKKGSLTFLVLVEKSTKEQQYINTKFLKSKRKVK